MPLSTVFAVQGVYACCHEIASFLNGIASNWIAILAVLLELVIRVIFLDTAGNCCQTVTDVSDSMWDNIPFTIRKFKTYF